MYRGHPLGIIRLKLYINLPCLSNSIGKIVRKEWVFAAVVYRGIPTKGMPLCNKRQSLMHAHVRSIHYMSCTHVHTELIWT